MFGFIAKKAVVFIIFRDASKSIQKLFIIEPMHNRVPQRLDFVIASFERDEIQINQKRLVIFRYLHSVDDGFVVIIACLFGRIADLTIFKQVYMKDWVSRLHHFFGGIYLPFYLLRQRVDSLFEQLPEEGQTFQHIYVCFSNDLFLISLRQMLYKTSFLFNIEASPELNRLVDIILNFFNKRFWKVIWLSHLAKYLPVLVDLLILEADIADEGSQAADVVRESDATDYLNEDDADGLLINSWRDISKSHSQHNGCGPVVGPDVSLVPDWVLDALDRLPVRVRVVFGHQVQENGYEMCEREVEQDDLHERPILFIVEIFNDKDLDFPKFLSDIVDFEEETDYRHVLPSFSIITNSQRD